MKARGVVVGLAIAGLAACGSSSGKASSATILPPVHTTPAGHSISGTIELNSSDVEDVVGDEAHCDSGSGGYEDVDEGAQVTLTSETGTILASTQLETGKSSGDGVCDFDFSFGDVTAKAKFYSVEIGHRGKITDSAAELAAADYSFSLTLGDGS